MQVLLRWVQAALLSLLVLIFAGAIVRATGSGLGCPDWPKCWGCFIPPLSVDQVDFDLIDLDRFKAKAERAGRNPDDITLESLHFEFNPLHTWVEFINRLFALPMLLTSLVAFILSLRTKEISRFVKWALGLSVFTVLLNAWLGAKVVYSGLKPGTITAHLALAFVLMILLIFSIVKLKAHLGRVKLPANKAAVWSGISMMVFLIIEGLMGAQLREVTDELAKINFGQDRLEWTGELKEMSVFYAHRTFSWSILLLSLLFGRSILRSRRFFTMLEGAIVMMVFMLMIMGVTLGHFGVFPWVQVLHVGFASLLFCSVTYWVFSQTLLPKENWDSLPKKRDQSTGLV